MKKRREAMTALLFLVIIGGMLIALLPHRAEIIRPAAEAAQTQQAAGAGFARTAAAVVDAVDQSVDAANPARNALIDLNGGWQRLMGKRVIEDANPDLDVVRMDNGQLVFPVKAVDMGWRADNLAALSQWCGQQNIPLLYVQAPFKVDPDDPQLPAGITDSANANADALLEGLADRGTNTLDLRAISREKGLDHAGMFYRTDSHWTTETAFWAYETLCRTLAGSGFTMDLSAADRDRFTKTTYADCFLGTQGKRVGKLYAGTDSVDLLVPSFPTHLRYTVPVHGIVREGSFAETVLDYSHVDPPDIYDKSAYYVYSGGDYPTSTIENLNHPDGKHILLVRDSFSCAVAPFLSLAVGQLDTFDLRYNQEPLTDFIARTQPDLVLFLFNPGVLKDDVMFRYGLD